MASKSHDSIGQLNTKITNDLKLIWLGNKDIHYLIHSDVLIL